MRITNSALAGDSIIAQRHFSMDFDKRHSFFIPFIFYSILFYCEAAKIIKDDLTFGRYDSRL